MTLSTTRYTSVLWEQFRSDQTPVIPDIKCKSPAEGDLLFGRNPVEIAEQLVEAGARTLSVVTEREHFDGSLELLQRIAEHTKVPVLRKDFIQQKSDLIETVDAGASAVLLIVSMLEKEQLFHLYEDALELGLEPLVETHNETELQIARELELTFVGINNRNIVELELDDGTVAKTENLISYAPSEAFILSESSIASPQDVRRATEAGANGVLVGTAILQADDPASMYQKLSATRG